MAVSPSGFRPLLHVVQQTNAVRMFVEESEA